jgi:hypothetical protein
MTSSWKKGDIFMSFIQISKHSLVQNNFKNINKRRQVEKKGQHFQHSKWSQVGSGKKTHVIPHLSITKKRSQVGKRTPCHSTFFRTSLFIWNKKKHLSQLKKNQKREEKYPNLSLSFSLSQLPAQAIWTQGDTHSLLPPEARLIALDH